MFYDIVFTHEPVSFICFKLLYMWHACRPGPEQRSLLCLPEAAPTVERKNKWSVHSCEVTPLVFYCPALATFNVLYRQKTRWTNRCTKCVSSSHRHAPMRFGHVSPLYLPLYLPVYLPVYLPHVHSRSRKGGVEAITPTPLALLSHSIKVNTSQLWGVAVTIAM